MSSNIIPYTEFRVNIIYLLIKGKHSKAGRNVYKIGKTEQLNLERFLKDPEYKKGVTLLGFEVCVNCHTAEREALFLFNQKYTKLPGKAREYFIGNWIDMKKDMRTIAEAQLAGITDGRALYQNISLQTTAATLRVTTAIPVPRSTIVIIGDYQTYINHSSIADLIITNSATFAGYIKLRNEKFYRAININATSIFVTLSPTDKFINLLDSHKRRIVQLSSSNALHVEFDMKSIVADIIKTKTRTNMPAYELDYGEYIIQMIRPNVTSDNIYFVKLNQLRQEPILCSNANSILLHPSKIATIIFRPQSNIFAAILDSYFESETDRNQFRLLCYYILTDSAVREPVTLNERIDTIPSFKYDETYQGDTDYCLTDWLSEFTKDLRPDATPPLVAYSRDSLEPVPTPRMIIVESVDVFIPSSVAQCERKNIRHIVIRRQLVPTDKPDLEFNEAGIPYNAPIKPASNYNAGRLIKYLTEYQADIKRYLYQVNGQPTDLYDYKPFSKESIGDLFTSSEYFANEMALWAMHN